MKLVTFQKRTGGAEAVGILHKGETSVSEISLFGLKYGSMLDLIENISEYEMCKLKNAIDSEVEFPYSVDDIILKAPIPIPRQDIICLGVNYTEHAKESARYKKEAFDIPFGYPVYFSKRVNEAVGHNAEIPGYHNLTDCLDYEAELALIIKKDAKNVPLDRVAEYIFGYTIMNDMSARDLQTRHTQWYYGKSLDGFTPMGPCIVTSDEIDFPPRLQIQSRINGELRQNSNTDLLIFDIEYVIHELCQGMTLKAGTIISMGTPSGVGMGFTPPKFLHSGDVVECRIEQIGTLRNVIR